MANPTLHDYINAMLPLEQKIGVSTGTDISTSDTKLLAINYACVSMVAVVMKALVDTGVRKSDGTAFTANDLLTVVNNAYNEAWPPLPWQS